MNRIAYTPPEVEGSPPSAAVRARSIQIHGLRWWIALALMGVTVVNYLDRASLSVAAPVLKTRLGIDEVGFSHVVIAFQIAYLVMQPVSGRVIDWLDVRVGLAISIVWWSVAQMLTALAGGAPAFAFLRALLGVGEAGAFPGAARAIALWFRPRERTLATGVVNVGSGVGALLAPPLVVLLILRWGWQSAFVVTGAIGLGWVVVWLLVYRDPSEHPWMSAEERAFIAGGREELAVEETAGGGVWRGVLSRRRFWAIAVARFLSEPAWQFFTYWIPLYLATERGLRLKEIAYFAWLPFVAADLGSVFGGVLSPLFVRLGSPVLRARKLAATVSAVLMVCAVFIGHASTVAWAVFYFCVGAFAHQSMSSTLLTLPSDVFPRALVATANGLSGTVGMTGGMLFTLVVGIVAKRIGYGPIFVAIAVFDLVGAAFLWMLLPEEPAKGRA
ncbi:MAG TPA: MFS transporter [Polyangiaceae bacterium]|nr:MFS transporter [Polyangiaceae bacterium]